MAEQSPGFYFNVEKFFGSVSAQRMSFAEKGVYLVMMFQQWRDAARNLPDDPKAVADLIAVTPAQALEIEAAWDVVRRKFVTSDHTPNRIWNIAVEETRKKQRANFNKRRAAGRSAGKASAAKRVADKALPVNQSLTNVERSLNAVERSSTDKRREEESRSDLNRSDQNRAPASARSKRPIFNGQRLTVFEWMFDDCCKTLGPLTDDFGLDEWFWTLDAQATKAGLVIPQRDGGAWLQSQLVAEARRRGLPTAVATPVFGKQTTRLQAALANIKAEAEAV